MDKQALDPLTQRVAARWLGAAEHFWDKAESDLRVFNDRYAEAHRLREPIDEVGERLLNEFAFRKNGTAPSFIDTSFHKWMSLAFHPMDIDDPDAVRPMGAFILEVADGKRPLKDFLQALDRYKDALQAVVHATAPHSFKYQGFDIKNAEHISEAVARRMLEGVDYVVGLFKTHGLDHLLHDGVTSIDLEMDLGGSTHGLYFTGSRNIALSAKALGGSGRMGLKWINEVFLHEFGHYVHLHYLSKEAKEVWDHGWHEVNEKKKEVETAFKSISHDERVLFFKMIEAAHGNPTAAARKLKGIMKVKFGAWLRQPMMGGPLITDKQFRLTKDGEQVFAFFRDYRKFMAENYPHLEEGGPDYLQQFERSKRQRLDRLSLLYNGALPVPKSVVEELASSDPEMHKAVNDALAKLEIVSDYGKTNEKEDFAETFVAFVGAPGKLTPTAKFRMQQALSLSGFYGKQVMRLAAVNLSVGPEKQMDKLAFQVAARFQALQQGLDPLAVRVAAKYKDKKKTDKGNTVYMYSEKQIAQRNKKKAEQIEKLRGSIGKLRKKVNKDLSSKDPEKMLTALAVALMDHTYERVGNDESAKDGHYGVTGWCKKHVTFSGGKASIKYVGKSGVKHEKKVTDAAIKNALKNAYEAADGEDSDLFAWDGGSVTAEKVNAYLEPFDITAKDIRGFHANREMQERLKKIRGAGKALPKDKKAKEKLLKEEFKKALEQTADAVGHEAATLRSQYLVPGLEESFLEDGSVSDKFSHLLSESMPERIAARFLLGL